MSATIWLVNEMGRPPLERVSRRLRPGAGAEPPGPPAPPATAEGRPVRRRVSWRRLATGTVVVAAMATSAVSAHELTVGGDRERTVVVNRVQRVVTPAEASAPAERVVTVVREVPAADPEPPPPASPATPSTTAPAPSRTVTAPVTTAPPTAEPAPPPASAPAPTTTAPTTTAPATEDASAPAPAPAPAREHAAA